MNSSRGFTIVPAGDKKGSNAVACSPPLAVPLRFGDNSFYPHLDAARKAGIEPVIKEFPGIATDVDTPEDIQPPPAPGPDTPVPAPRAYLHSIGLTADTTTTESVE